MFLIVNLKKQSLKWIFYWILEKSSRIKFELELSNLWILCQTYSKTSFIYSLLKQIRTNEQKPAFYTVNIAEAGVLTTLRLDDPDKTLHSVCLRRYDADVFDKMKLFRIQIHFTSHLQKHQFQWRSYELLSSFYVCFAASQQALNEKMTAARCYLIESGSNWNKIGFRRAHA